MAITLFETKRPLTLLWRFSWPSILSLLASSLYSVVDRAFVGHYVGTNALTAVSVAFPLVIALFAVDLGVGSGAATQVSLCLGKKDTEGAERALGQTLGLSVAASAVFVVAVLPLTVPVLTVLGTPPEVIGPARDYFWVILAGTPFLAVNFGLGLAVRSQGRAKSSMVLGLVGFVVNVVLCAFFVGSLGWGIVGSAWATVIAEAVGALVTVLFYFTPLSHLRIRAKNLVPVPREMAELALLGLPSFAFQGIQVLMMAVLNARVQGFGGVEALASVGIITTLINVFYMPVVGLVQGAVPLFGYYQGAGTVDRNRKVFFWTLSLSAAFFLLCTVLIEFLPDLFAAIFTQDPVLVNFCLAPLRIFLFLTPLGALQVLVPSYFQAIGKPVPALVISLVKPVVLLGLIVGLPMFWGYNGFLAAGPLSDLTGAGFALAYLAGAPVVRRTAPSVDSPADLPA